MIRSVITAGGLALVMSSLANADFIAEDVPSWRGDANTAYYSWESFTSADGIMEKNSQMRTKEQTQQKK